MKRYFSLILLLMAALTGKAQSGNSEAKPNTKTQTATQARVKVFPNPATNLINVLGLKNTPKADISIMDIYGNIVLSYQWAIRRNALNIPVSSLDTGAYIIHIHSEEQQIRTKFYKQ